MALNDKLRRSQVIFTSGPGSIVDLRDYSGVVAGLEEWRNLDKLEEISFLNRRGFRRLLRPPTVRTNPFSNKEITPFGTMPTFRFPEWVQCTNPACNAFGPFRKISNVKSDYKCLCGHSFVAARIIKICPDGHMDDYPWDEFYHDGTSCELPHPKFQLFTAKDQKGSLDDLVLQCKCGKHPSGKSLGAIYEFPLGRHCRGRRPWLNSETAGCTHRSEVVLRGASNVYFPKIMSELIVPKSRTKLELFFADYLTSHKKSYFVMQERRRAAFISDLLDEYKTEVDKLGLGRPELISEIRDFFEGKDRKKETELTPEEKIREDEFQILNNPAIVNPDIIPKVFSAKRIAADVTLQNRGLANLVSVSRLQEIRVLQGFSRVRPYPKKDKGRIIDLGEATDGAYLAIEVNGEGLFLSFDNTRLLQWSKKREVAQRSSELEALFSGEPGFRPIPFSVDARAIFLHSFAHALIKQMALFGGYSSVAIREKIYLGPQHNGILIYTGESDSEGTMGGITNLGDKDKFTEIFLEAIEDCRWCSSDPICSENSPRDSSSENMAACHACLHLSETSCEFSNKLLDRLMVISDIGTGFFDE